MKRVVPISLLVLGLTLGGLSILSGALLALALPLLVYLGVGLLHQPPEPNLKVARTLETERAARGQPVRVRLTVTNMGRSLEEVVLRDLVPERLRITDGYAEVLTRLRTGETVKLEYELQGERGSYRFPGVEGEIRESFGLLTRRIWLPSPSHLTILPEVIKLRRTEIRPWRTRVYSGIVPARRGGPGVEFYGVRPYQPGDPLRWVNERASARHPHLLLTNEFRQERVADVGMILDARLSSQVHARGDALFEHSVHATAALADAFLSYGNRVGLLIYGRYLNWTVPGYGKVQRERILRALARARPGENPAFDELRHLPTRLFPAGSQLVFIGSLLQPSSDREMMVRLRARGYAVTVISPDPVSFERKALNEGRDVVLATRIALLERELTLRVLRRAGIRVANWDVEVPFAKAVQAVLGRSLAAPHLRGIRRLR